MARPLALGQVLFGIQVGPSLKPTRSMLRPSPSSSPPPSFSSPPSTRTTQLLRQWPKRLLVQRGDCSGFYYSAGGERELDTRPARPLPRTPQSRNYWCATHEPMIGHPLDSVPGRAYSSGNDCPVYAEIVGVNRKATCCTNSPVRHVLRTRHVPVLLRQAGKCTCARKATPAPTVPRAVPGGRAVPGKVGTHGCARHVRQREPCYLWGRKH